MHRHIAFSNTSTHAHLLRGLLNDGEQFLTKIRNVTATMELMLEGDNKDDSSYAYMADKFGFSGPAAARAAYMELLSARGKVTTNDSVTSVLAALEQLFNILR